MKKQYLYWYFCGYLGLQYAIFDTEMSDDKYHFIEVIELPDIPKERILQAGVDAIDKEIAELQLKITNNQKKKQELLAISHKEG